MNQPPPHASSLFRGRHFDHTVIILCARWYITYKLSYRDLVGQDHRRVKQRIYPMPGFKQFRNAAVMIGGRELVQKIRKGQFDTSAVTMRDRASVRHVWEAVPAA